MMQHLKSTLGPDDSYTFLDSGTTDRRLRSFLRVLGVVFTYRDKNSIFHINIASRGSTYRKAVIALILLVTKRTYVLHLHGAAYREFYRDSNPVVKLLIRTIFGRASRVLVLGNAWRSFVTQSLRVPAARVGILPNAVPGPNRVPDRSASPVSMLFLGRSGVRKGTREILKAIEDLHTTSSWRMRVAGDTENAATRDDLEAATSVEYSGWLGQEAMSGLLSEASIFVLPSHAEGLPLALLDAMAWGLAPIVTNVGSISDAVVDGTNGCFVEVRDPKGLKDAMQSLIDNAPLRLRLGQNARASWEQEFNVAKYRKRLEGEYATLLAEEGSSDG